MNIFFLLGSMNVIFYLNRSEYGQIEKHLNCSKSCSWVPSQQPLLQNDRPNSSCKNTQKEEWGSNFGQFSGKGRFSNGNKA